MEQVAIRDLPAREMAPGVRLPSVWLEKVMVTFGEFAPGAEVPLHSHPHEQISVIIEGALLFRVGAKSGWCQPVRRC